MNKYLGIGIALIILLTGCQGKEVNANNEPAYTGAFATLDVNVRKELFACDIDQTEFDRLLALPVDKFDQDRSGGWRVTGYKERCRNAAAELIKTYMLYSHPLPPEEPGMLRWHAGQMKAYAGNYDEAVLFFRGTYQSPDDHGEDWNYYVDATVAFLEGDRDALQDAYDGLASIEISDSHKEERRQFLKNNPDISMPEGFVDEPANLSVVRGLLNCFGQPYAKAYGGKCRD